MKTINLRWMYPHYRHDEFVDVTDEVWAAMYQAKREMENYERRKVYHRAYYSLDASAPVKKSVAPPSESSGSEYELYHVSNHLHKTFLRPAGPLRLAGRFLLFSEDKPASKKFFEKFSKRRLLAGSERLCVRLVSGKGETHLIPPGKGVKRWI